MNPQAPYGSGLTPPPVQTPPGNTNPYEFILNPPPKPRRSLVPFGGGSFGMKIAIILGGAFLLMILLTIIASLLGGTSNTDRLVGLAQSQSEIVRISGQGAIDGTQQTTKNLAITARLSVKTQQAQLLRYLGQKGRNVDEKELTLKQNATTDQQLLNAKQTSTFDLVYSQITEQQLRDYATTLQQIFQSSTDPAERSLLSGYYTQTQLLISQIPYAQQSLQGTN